MGGCEEVVGAGGYGDAEAVAEEDAGGAVGAVGGA